MKPSLYRPSLRRAEVAGRTTSVASRATTRVSGFPFDDAIASAMSFASTCLSSIDTIVSPERRPALAAGEPDRDAEIIEVHGDDGAPPYLVRWDEDGHEGLFFPGPDATIEHFQHSSKSRRR